VERAEAEAIYDLGRDRCVEVMLELAASVERLVALNHLADPDRIFVGQVLLVA